MIRSGYTATYYEYEEKDPKRLDEAGTAHPHLAGVAQTEEMKRWLHDSWVSLFDLIKAKCRRTRTLTENRYFSAVAGDAPSFECWPPKEWALVRSLSICRVSKLTIIARVSPWIMGSPHWRDV